MAKVCNHQECNYPVWAKGYCRKHQYLRTDKKVKKASRYSEKMLQDLKIYKVERLKFLERHPVCQAAIKEVCTIEALQIHHKKGRIGDLLTDPTYFLAVCHSCHVYIEMNPGEAKDKGWSLSRG